MAVWEEYGVLYLHKCASVVSSVMLDQGVKA